jgi:hypothetical protein
MVQKRKQFDGLFAQLQDVQDSRGNTLTRYFSPRPANAPLSSKWRIPCSSGVRMPSNMRPFQDVLANIVQTLGEGYASRNRMYSAGSGITMR